jgi:hypothetical protein
MRRPGIWVANGTPGDTAQLYSWQPGAIGSFYHYLAENDVYDYKATNPTIPVVVRFEHPKNWLQNPTITAQQLGKYVAGKWTKLQPLNPYVYFASHLNMHYENGDPDPGHQARYTTREFYQEYADWVRMTADTIKNIAPEMRLIAPPLAFGFNEDGAPDADGHPINGWAGYDYLYETVREYFDNILAFHAYWGYPAVGSVPDWLYAPELSSWYAFRWQRLLKLFKSRYNLDARVIIDEVASFGATDPDFTDQLIYYAQQCLNDPRVLAVIYYLWADSSGDSRATMNAWIPGIDDLSRHLARLKQLESASEVRVKPSSLPPTVSQGVVAMSGQTREQTTIRVLFEDGQVRRMPLEEYLRNVVPSEMPALWPDEALKAQAVASRSYAQHAIEHPRHKPEADICTTTHCQHFNAANVHERSDKAIQATAGQVLQFDGKTALTVFHARCGGHTRNNEDVWTRGAPRPFLRGVPCPDNGKKFGHGVGFCQHGARVFAEQGRDYENIVRHYYQGTSLHNLYE